MNLTFVDPLQHAAKVGHTDGALGPDLQIVLPAYNEADALPRMLQELDQMFRQRGWRYRVTVVDDGSGDETANIVRTASESMPVTLVPHPENLGLAAAMRTGLSRAVDEADEEGIIITMDSDNTHPIGLIPRMVDLIHEGHDIVVASRFRRQSRVRGVSKFRQLTSVVAGMMFGLIFPIRGVRDYTCGFRAYRVSAMRKAFEAYGNNFISEEGFSCMVDILLKMSRLNLICGEAPMILRYDKKVGDSKMPVGKTIFATLKLAAKRRLGILD